MTGGSLSLKKNTNNADEKEDLEETLRTNVLRLRRVRVPTSALFDAANNESFEDEEEGESNIRLSAANEGGLVSGCAIKIDARNGVILDVWRESEDGRRKGKGGGERRTRRRLRKLSPRSLLFGRAHAFDQNAHG